MFETSNIGKVFIQRQTSIHLKEILWVNLSNYRWHKWVKPSIGKSDMRDMPDKGKTGSHWMNEIVGQEGIRYCRTLENRSANKSYYHVILLVDLSTTEKSSRQAILPSVSSPSHADFINLTFNSINIHYYHCRQLQSLIGLYGCHQHPLILIPSTLTRPSLSNWS